MSKVTKKEIEEHIKEEISRKTPQDKERIREARELNRRHKQWLAEASWKEIEGKISEAGLLPGMAGYEEIRKLYQQVQRRKKHP